MPQIMTAEAEELSNEDLVARLLAARTKADGSSSAGAANRDSAREGYEDLLILQAETVARLNSDTETETEEIKTESQNIDVEVNINLVWMMLILWLGGWLFTIGLTKLDLNEQWFPSLMLWPIRLGAHFAT